MESGHGLWNNSRMTTNVEKRPYSVAEWAILLIARALTAALLTAFVGAIENWLYERFFAPELYAAGPPLSRGVFLAVFSFPYILVGLLLLGLPCAYLLHRMRAESALTYALAGLVTGALWGAVALPNSSPLGFVLCGLYGCVCALFWWWIRPRG